MPSPRLLLGLLLISPTAALAHAHLLTPTPRNTTANKTGPCGSPRTATATNFAPGQTITVTWTETIDHPGSYRIAFSPAGDTGFDANVLKDNIPNPVGAQASNSTTVTLPTAPRTDCTLQLIQVMTNTTPPSNYYSCADITIGSGANVAPTVATAAAATPATVAGTTTALTVLGADDAGESALSYAWSATTAPATVTFSANGSNAAKSTTASFARAGAYVLQVTATDAGGLSVSSTVNVTVAATLTSVLVAPASASVAVAGTRQFSATGYDQFSLALATPPAMTWTVSGGGAVSAAGLFTAGATVGGPFSLTASSGGKSGTAMVSVTAGTAPTVAQPATAASPTVTGTSVALSALGADDAPESNLTYTWAAPGAPMPVTFSANGTNAAKATTATFSGAGSYSFTVTIKDAGNLTVTSAASVAVAQAATAVSVSPSAATVQPGATQAFAAAVSDQFGRPLVAPPSIGWAVSGGGTIAVSGTFTAGVTAGGPFTVTAMGGGKSGTASVSVSAANPPSVVTPATAATTSVNGTSVGLSALGADDSGEAQLTYTWAATSAPAAVGFSANGTNAAKATTASFTRAGVYGFEVTIKDAANLTTTSAVSVTVNQALTTVAVSPPTTSVAVGRTLAFAASAADQFGVALASQPAFAWAVGGGGTITAAGLFTAGAAVGGPFTVTASSGGKSGTGTLSVTAADAPTVAQAANASPAQVTGKSTQLSALGADDGGEAALTYRWAATTAPVPVTFSANGTNAAKDVTATFAAPGLYRFEVTITDAGGKTAVSGVEVTVEQTVTRIAVSPLVTTVAASSSLRFTALAQDQFDATLAAQPMFQWSASGGGAMSASGLFTAGATSGGPFTVTAQVGSVSGTAQVNVTAAGVDSAFPEVSVEAPTAGAVLAGTVSLSASASDDVGVVEVAFALNGQVVGTAAAAPWTVSFDSATTRDGAYGLVAIAKDAAGNASRSAVVQVRVQNGSVNGATGGCAATPGPPLLALFAFLAARLGSRRRRSVA